MKKTLLSLICLSLFSFQVNASNHTKTEKPKLDNPTVELKTPYGDLPTDTSLVSRLFSKLPFENAIKKVAGNGYNMIAMFSDANCPYCLRQEYEIGQSKQINSTFYTFLVDLKPDPLKINEYIWCSEDKQGYYTAWMKYRAEHIQDNLETVFNEWKKTYNKSQSCNTPFETNKKLMYLLLNQNNMVATPSYIFANGAANIGSLKEQHFVNAFKHLQANPESPLSDKEQEDLINHIENIDDLFEKNEESETKNEKDKQ